MISASHLSCVSSVAHSETLSYGPVQYRCVVFVFALICVCGCVVLCCVCVSPRTVPVSGAAIPIDQKELCMQWQMYQAVRCHAVVWWDNENSYRRFSLLYGWDYYICVYVCVCICVFSNFSLPARNRTGAKSHDSKRLKKHKGGPCQITNRPLKLLYEHMYMGIAI